MRITLTVDELRELMKDSDVLMARIERVEANALERDENMAQGLVKAARRLEVLEKKSTLPLDRDGGK